DSVDPAAEPPADVAGDAVPGDESAETAPDLVPAEPVNRIAAGEQALKTNISEFGARSVQAAEAHIDLANAQREAREFEKAAENYLAAVEVYRSVDGPFTPLAIGPLTSLGDNYHEAEDDANAVAAYSEARTVSRRAYGLHNTEQIELLDRMSRSLLDLNQLSEAEAQQLEALRLVQRAYPPGSDEVLEGIYKYAEWLGDRQFFQLQRDQYARALRMIRQIHGERDVRQVQPLLGIGNTYREERNPASMGISALEEALNLLLEQPERDPVLTAMALRDMGDWAVAFGRTGYSGTEYQRAWQLLGSVPNGAAIRRQWFTGANYVLYEPISPRGLSMDPDALSGHVTVSFDIETGGNTENVVLVESNPAGLKDEAVLRHIRRSRFRPVLENGNVVVGKSLAIQVKFRYLPETAAAAAADDDAN
ncbi:MAG TPA: TonB family protein, partial [Gammaproteobacteria bacterium]|nr:TonB family protein [Gammaproteobacteria bacterium]